MKYCSMYLWEKGCREEKNSISLVLQQVQMGRQSVLLGCVCNDTNGRLAEALVEWFHRECLCILERKWTEIELEKSLQKEVAEILKELAVAESGRGLEKTMEFVGVLLVGAWFCVFSKGEAKMYLLNRRFNRKHMRVVTTEADSVYWQSGIVQRRVGLLLCGKEFWGGMDLTEVAQILLAEGEIKEERFEKRLRELWQTQEKSGKSVGAVLIWIY